MNAKTPGYKRKMVGLCTPMTSLVFVLLLTGCSVSSLTTSPVQISNQADATKHPPVIQRVEERTESQNGQLLLHKDFYFIDTEGDAITIVNRLVATDPAGLRVDWADDLITTPGDEQKLTGLATSTMKCPMVLYSFSVMVEDRIRDVAGSLSEPVIVTFSCPSNPPNSIPPLIMAAVFGIIFLIGFWLVFRKTPIEGKTAILSTLLLFFTLFPLYFMGSIFHEGGHALANLVLGKNVWDFYVHPFTFSGYVRPFTDNVWFHAAGHITNLLVSFVIFCLFWKRRSIANLPFVMLFPYEAISQGFFILILNGDIANILRITELPATIFVVLGFVLVCAGLFFLFALFPRLGLAPEDKKSLLVVATAFFLQGALGMLVAHLFVPDSAFNFKYLDVGVEIIQSANTLSLGLPILGAFFSLTYITLFRKVRPKLPVGLRLDVVNLTLRDLRIPGLLFIASMIVGLIAITWA